MSPSYTMLTGCSNICGFQSCSEKCQKLYKRHTTKECQYIKKMTDKNPDQWLTVLRVLMIRQDNSEQFQNFMLLEDHLQDRIDCPIMKNNKTGVFDVLKRCVPELLEDLNAEDILRICGILDANSFRIDKNGSRGLFLGKSFLSMLHNFNEERETLILFAAMSMVNHSCLPNARVVFDPLGNANLVAKQDIKKGENVTITYCTLLTNTLTRQQKLKKSKFFTCQCQLCHDPREKGTLMSAMICPKCQGNLLPESFFLQPLEWKCDKCTFTTTDDKVQKLIDAVRNQVNAVCSNSRMLPTEKVQELESILKKRSGKVLPPTNQVMLDLKIELANLYDATKDVSHLQRRIDIIKERLDILEKLEGEDVDSRLKGFLLFRLHNLLVARIAMLHKNKALNDKNIKELGQELSNSLTDATRILYQDYGCPQQLMDTIATVSRVNGNAITQSKGNQNHV